MESKSSHPKFNIWIYVLILALILSILACSVGAPKATPTALPTATKIIPTAMPIPTNTVANMGDLYRQWASGGEATSEFGSVSWTASQAAGAPDTPTCGDFGSAWASSSSNGLDSLTMYFYDQPVIPTQINIVQSYNPSQVIKVELLDANGQYNDATIYQAAPASVNQCPYTLSIPVTGITYLVMGVRITIDQSVLGLGWNEIDAVELVGYPQVGAITQPGTGSTGTMPGLVGTWQDPETTDIFVITYQSGQYVVTSVTWEGNSYSIVSQYWDGSSLTWSYYDTDLPMTVTYTTTSLSGDNLYVDWSYSDGSNGTETLGRLP
jgi:hypothetical protein